MNAAGPANANGPVIIRKYANRRLYDTDGSTYVTLDDLARMVREGRDVVVQDAKTGEDISRSVLTQIVLEQEARGQPLLSVGFLKDLIRLHGQELHDAVGAYLDFSIANLKREQDRLRRRPGGIPDRPGALAAQVRRNIELFERAIGITAPPCDDDAASGRLKGPVLGTEAGAELERIRNQLEAMQVQLDALSERI